MEATKEIQFGNPEVSPTEENLKEVLGDSFSVYKLLLETIHSNNLTYEWNYYKDGKSWLCKIQKKKKTIFWLSAWKDYFETVFYIQENHMENICALSLSKEQVKKIVDTKNVGKLKPCIFEMKSQENFNDFIKVMNYKLSVL